MNIKDIIKKEGNYKNWTYTCKNGLEIQCVIKRTKGLNILCGYVKLDKDFDIYGSSSFDLVVHGGVTYTGYEDNSWLIGFDCGHYNDLVPGELKKLKGIIEFSYNSNKTYRDMEFVTSECESMAEQISINYSKIKLRDNKLKKILND